MLDEIVLKSAYSEFHPIISFIKSVITQRSIRKFDLNGCFTSKNVLFISPQARNAASIKGLTRSESEKKTEYREDWGKDKS